MKANELVPSSINFKLRNIIYAHTHKYLCPYTYILQNQKMPCIITYMLNKNALGCKTCKANQKQNCKSLHVPKTLRAT